MRFSTRFLLSVGLVAAVTGLSEFPAFAASPTLIFDSMTGHEASGNGVPNGPGNTFIGSMPTVAGGSGATGVGTITGIDIKLAQSIAGTASGYSNNDTRVNLYFWAQPASFDTLHHGLAFANLIASRTVTLGALNNVAGGSFVSYEGAVAGTVPFAAFAPVTFTNGTICVTANFETQAAANGAFASMAGLTSAIGVPSFYNPPTITGTGQPTVGSNGLEDATINGPDPEGWFRNDSATATTPATLANFDLFDDSRFSIAQTAAAIGTPEYRLYGTFVAAVPEPASIALLSVSTMLLGGRRRSHA